MEPNIILVVFANKFGYGQERLFLILSFSSTRGTQWSFMGKINIGEWARWVLFQGTPASLHRLCILGVEGGRGGSSRERAGVVLQLFISVHGSCHLASALLASRSALRTPATPAASSRQRGWACPHCDAWALRWVPQGRPAGLRTRDSNTARRWAAELCQGQP